MSDEKKSDCAEEVPVKKLSNMYRVVSDGTLAGTQLLDANGKMVARVTSIRWEADIDKILPTITITAIGAEIDAQGEIHVTKRVENTLS